MTKIGKIQYGFKLIEEKNIEELNSVGRLFIHEKSGAPLFHIENDDDNKVFSLSFRTPPEDSTGLPHILEHSVLCGSKKFPVKEPFVELVKGSLNTFLNAMTFDDKTMYPVASKNDKDFENLMDVYLDAVFFPSIYKKPEILMQEGWHYELLERNAELSLKGVVYNEMKGVFSSPEAILFRKITEFLFPDTAYRFDSGGDPEEIPNLTQEAFLKYHKKYYHPSNSWFYLYGNGDINNHLRFLDKNYLAKFNAKKVNSKIPLQKPFSKPAKISFDYPISPKEKKENKTYLCLSYVTDTSTNPELYIALEILSHMLLETPASPLKQALIKSGLGKDVFGSFDNSILQPTFSIVLKNSKAKYYKKFKTLISETLLSLVKNGLPKKLIQASINAKEFKLRESSYGAFPKGLMYCIKSMDSWLYGKSPFTHLQYNPILEKIKTALTEDYFERLIDLYLLKNSHNSLIIMNPNSGMVQKREKSIKEKLKKFKLTLSNPKLDEIIAESKNLKTLQETPDSEKNLARLPLLKLRDIKKKSEIIPQEIKKEDGVTLLNHSIFTNQIAYVKFLFDPTTVKQELIPYISLLSEILSKVDTKNFSYSDLANEININTGGIHFGIATYVESINYQNYLPKFLVNGKCFIEKLPNLFEIITEIIHRTIFEDKNRLKEIIQESKSRLEMAISQSGHLVAANRLFSYLTDEGGYSEVTGGLSYYKFLAKLEKDFPKKSGSLITNLQSVCKSIFTRNNLTVSITMDKKYYSKFSKNLKPFLNKLPRASGQKQNYRFETKAQNEGLSFPGKVQYVVQGYNFKKLGFQYTGVMQVFLTIIRLDYLWNRLRVQGGAYGAYAGFSRTGDAFFASYRDPNLKETLAVYDTIADYLKKFSVSSREMTKYIIGTISKVDSPLTPSMKGQHATANYLCKVTEKDIQRERDEILKTKQEDIRDMAEMVTRLMSQNSYCVLGSDSKIEENQKLFSRIIQVFE